MKTSLSILFIGLTCLLFSCSSSSSPRASQVYLTKDGDAISAASFKGKSIIAFRDWVSKNIAWPSEFVAKGFVVTVKVTFVVDSEGKVTDVLILDKEAVPELFHKPIYDVFARSPKWTPMYKNGEPIASRYNMGIAFKNPVAQSKQSTSNPAWAR